MTILTTQQKRVLNGIKFFQAEYQGGVPYNILKLDLDISAEDLNLILEFLEGENYISRQDGIILLQKNIEMQKAEDSPQETQSEETSKETVGDNISEAQLKDSADKNDDNAEYTDKTADSEDSRDLGDSEDEIKDQLSEVEQQSLDIIAKLVDDSGNISRTLLEGTLLYGELELSNIRMYNLITSLENKGILKKINLTDGEYYNFTPELWS